MLLLSGYFRRRRYMMPAADAFDCRYLLSCHAFALLLDIVTLPPPLSLPLRHFHFDAAIDFATDFSPCLLMRRRQLLILMPYANAIFRHVASHCHFTIFRCFDAADAAPFRHFLPPYAAAYFRRFSFAARLLRFADADAADDSPPFSLMPAAALRASFCFVSS